MNFINLLLSPVFLVQGLWVKLKTPKLPEHINTEHKTKAKHQANSHSVEQSAKLNILLLGDSSAAGVGAYDFDSSLMGQLKKQIPCPIDHAIWAKSGDTTQAAIDKLNQQETQTFDVVITALGVNDVTRGTKLSDWQTQQKHLISILKSKHNAQLIIVCGLPPMDKFTALPQPLRGFFADKATRMDSALQQLLENEAKVIFLPLNKFPENLPTASDGFHPGPEAYHYWARQLSLAITRHFDLH